MNKQYLFVKAFLLSLLVLPVTTKAQITVVPNQTATILADKLVGAGVNIMNPTLTCANGANGTFSGLSSLSFDSGIVLTSGSAANTSRPASFFSSVANGTAGDPQLTTLAGQQTYDACVLQFDFRPAGDTIKFQYVFGSEEYNGFTCSGFNDVFGFFVSGPGIAGLNNNIALVPGTTIPVCINSVNCGGGLGGPIATCHALGAGSPFCTYYVNNIAGTTIVYDGITTTLTAIQPVTPCDTYHLKIGIADASDDIYDSGVFLKAGSLTSTSFSTKAIGINPADTGFGSQYCIRGCSPGMFIFHNTGSLNDSIIVHYTIAGTAVNGVDYTTIADSTIIHAHDSTDTVFIYGLTSASGTKTVKLLVYSPYSCNGLPTIMDSIQLTIYDSFFVDIVTPDTSICIGQHVLINTSGSNTLNYSWSPSGTLNNNTLQSPTATPAVTTTYVVTAGMPLAGCPPSHDQVTITVISPPALNVGAPIQNTCLGIPLQIGVVATPPAAYGYSWTPTTYLNNPAIANPIVTPGVISDQEYVVTVISPVAGCNNSDSFLLHVLPNDFNLYNPDTSICYPSGTFQIRSNGDSEFSYHWLPPQGVSNPNIIDPTVTPPGSLTYSITASYPGCPDITHSVTYSIENPRVNILIQDTTYCGGLPIAIPVVTTPVDSPFTFAWSPTTDGNLSDPNLLEPSFFTSVPGVYTYTLTIQSSLGCTSMDTVTFRPHPPINVSVTPAYSTIMYGQQLQLQANDLTPDPLYYHWTPNDGTISNPNINDPIVAPTDSTTYTVYATNAWGCMDTVSAIVRVEHTNECIPSAFTPNGDGLNDVFRLCNLTYERLVDFSVFNRWGTLVYHNTNDATKGWDGTYNGVPQDMGVYNYVIIIARVDGTNKIYKGDVTLIR